MEHITTKPDLLGECPVWDSDAEVLWWTDIRLDHRPGSLALTPRPDHLLVAMEHQVGLFDWREGLWKPWQDLEPAGTGNRLNDGRCDPVGRFWVGSMFERSGEGRSTGLLHRLEPSGASSTVRSEIGVIGRTVERTRVHGLPRSAG